MLRTTRNTEISFIENLPISYLPPIPFMILPLYPPLPLIIILFVYISYVSSWSVDKLRYYNFEVSN